MLELNFIEWRPLYWIDMWYKVTTNFSLNAGYNTNYEILALGASYRKASITFYGNDIGIHRAMSAGLKFSYAYEW